MQNKRKWFSYLIIIGILSSIGLYSYQLYVENEEFYNPNTGGFNYFLEAEEHFKLGYVVNTTHCRILNISSWDKSLISVISSNLKLPVDCGAQKKQWTYVDGENLILNVTNLAEFGHTIDSIYCCYKTVSRVEQNQVKYDTKADSEIKFSENCQPFRGQITKIATSEFVRVHCIGKYFPYASDVLYRQFHALVLPMKNDQTKRKIEYWSMQASKAKAGSSPTTNSQLVPPNVMIIGIDSLSRLGFRRNMQMTKQALEEIGAVEFFGYTKVGENTFPNSVAFLSGYYEEELIKICYFSNDTPQDLCPYIWKEFAKANYLTAIVEDAPLIGGFNYVKTGFVEQPVDFYFRPFMLSLHKLGLTLTYILDCIGYRTVDELLLQYISDLVSMSKNKSTPLFLYSWLTNLAHNDVNAAQFGDGTYANFIRNLDLNNTILFFISDHGYRYGKVRQTFAGWYEDKLPNFWAYLPSSLKLKYPNWNESLHANTDRLTSPFDLYKTIQQVLETFIPGTAFPSSFTKNGSELPRRFGQSFFKEIPLERKCEDAGISNSFCACIAPRMLPSNNTELKLAAEGAVSHINKLLPSACLQLSLSSVSGGAVLDQNNSPNYSSSHRTESKFVVDFYTKPGNFLFEATVTKLSNNALESPVFIVDPELLRMNQISTDVSCIKDGVIERFCYCAFLEKGRDSRHRS